MNPPDQSHIENLAKIVKALSQAPSYRVRDFKLDPTYSQNTHQGIYAITNAEDGSVIYVGKTNDGTKEKGVADRIWGHSAKGSDLQSALGITQEEFDSCKIQTIPIGDSGERGLVELYGIAIYAPKGNRYGHRGIATDLDDRTPTF
jgi:hypothetical protein